MKALVYERFNVLFVCLVYVGYLNGFNGNFLFTNIGIGKYHTILILVELLLEVV